MGQFFLFSSTFRRGPASTRSWPCPWGRWPRPRKSTKRLSGPARGPQRSAFIFLYLYLYLYFFIFIYLYLLFLYFYIYIYTYFIFIFICILYLYYIYIYIYHEFKINNSTLLPFFFFLNAQAYNKADADLNLSRADVEKQRMNSNIKRQQVNRLSSLKWAPLFLRKKIAHICRRALLSARALFRRSKKCLKRALLGPGRFRSF